MKTAKTTSPIYRSLQDIRVDEEIASMRSVFKKVNSSPEAARAFLRKAGIIDAKGKLTKPYR